MSERTSGEAHALARAFAARPPASQMRDDCPPPAGLYEALAGRLAEPERLAVVDHLSVCADCAMAWRVGSTLEQTPTQTRSRWTSTSTWTLAAAASLLLTVMAVMLLRDPAPQAPPGYRDGTAPQATGALQSRVPAEALPRSAFRLRWSPGAPDATYTVRVTDMALAPLAVAQGLTEPEFLVPTSALEKVEPGGAVLWQVEMRRSDGTGAVSPTYSTAVQ